MSCRPARPVLRYHGGKWLLAKWIISHFPPHRIYVEPFGGAASVLLQKPRVYAEVYNDLDGEVVNVFEVLRDTKTAAQLERALRLTPFARSEFEEAYQEADNPIERARRTIVRSFIGFGSGAVNPGHKTGFRGKSFRSGTSPAWDWHNYPDNLSLFTERLQGVCLENRSAMEILDSHDRADVLFYVDPPYCHEARQRRGKDTPYRHEMSDEEHRVLAEKLLDLEGMVVLSAYPCSIYDELLEDWEVIERQALSDGANPRTECLWLNHKAQQQRPGLLTFAGDGV